MNDTSKTLRTVFLSGGLILATLLAGCSDHNRQPKPLELKKASMVIKDSQLRHVVLFKFKEGTDSGAIANVEAAFEALPGKIPQIQAFEWGLNNSPEGLDKGFTHCYLLTFNSEEDRAIYLPHADHKAFGALLDGMLDDVMVVDYWAK